MPTYAYRGTACTHEFDIFQKFIDATLTECPECGGPIRRVFQPVGVVFKGSGWYINDSRASKSAPASSTTENKSADGKGEVDKSSTAAPSVNSDKKEKSDKTANASTR